MDSYEGEVNNLMEMAKGITNKILYKVGALGYGLLGKMSFKEFLPGVDQTKLDQTSLKDLLKELGCVMQSLDKIQGKYRNSKETNKIREDIRKITKIPKVSKENKAILYDWLWKHMGRARRSLQKDCKYQLKY